MIDNHFFTCILSFCTVKVLSKQVELIARLNLSSNDQGIIETEFDNEKRKGSREIKVSSGHSFPFLIKTYIS